jgi:hypothetical protein
MVQEVTKTQALKDASVKYLKYFVSKRWIRCKDSHNFNKADSNKKSDILVLMAE